MNNTAPVLLSLIAQKNGRLTYNVVCARADHNQNVRTPEGHWIRQKARLGGGAVFSAGCHRIDLLHWIVGEVAAVSCFGAFWPERMEGEVAGTVNLQYVNGAVGTMMINWMARRSPWYEGFWVYGTEGSVHNLGGVYLDSAAKTGESGYVKQEIESRHAFTEEIRHFGQCSEASPTTKRLMVSMKTESR